MTAAILSPRARRDVLGAVRWIARDNPAAAREFLTAVDNAAETIGRFRFVGVSRPDLARTRYRLLSLTNFPYIIVYVPDRDPPVIVRVLHGARDLPRVLRDLR